MYIHRKISRNVLFPIVSVIETVEINRFNSPKTQNYWNGWFQCSPAVLEEMFIKSVNEQLQNDYMVSKGILDAVELDAVQIWWFLNCV